MYSINESFEKNDDGEGLQSIELIQIEIKDLMRLKEVASTDLENERKKYEDMGALDDGDIVKITQQELVEQLEDNLLKINDELAAKQDQLEKLKGE